MREERGEKWREGGWRELIWREEGEEVVALVVGALLEVDPGTKKNQNFEKNSKNSE
jgi:hypothetical protein